MNLPGDDRSQQLDTSPFAIVGITVRGKNTFHYTLSKLASCHCWTQIYTKLALEVSLLSFRKRYSPLELKWHLPRAVLAAGRRSASPRQASGGLQPPVTTQLEGRGKGVAPEVDIWATHMSVHMETRVLTYCYLGFQYQLCRISHSTCPLWKSVDQAPIFQ